MKIIKIIGRKFEGDEVANSRIDGKML